jgi:hypothetical protein
VTIGEQAFSQIEKANVSVWEAEEVKMNGVWVSGTIKRQKGHFVHVECTLNIIERESQNHLNLRFPLFMLKQVTSLILISNKFVVPLLLEFCRWILLLS